MCFLVVLFCFVEFEMLVQNQVEIPGMWELVRTVSVEDAHFFISHSEELDVLGLDDLFKSGNEEGQDWSLIPTKYALISTGDPREM